MVAERIQSYPPGPVWLRRLVDAADGRLPGAIRPPAEGQVPVGCPSAGPLRRSRRGPAGAGRSTTASPDTEASERPPTSRRHVDTGRAPVAAEQHENMVVCGLDVLGRES